MINNIPRYIPVGTVDGAGSLQIYHDTTTDEYVMEPHGIRKVVPKPAEPINWGKLYPPDKLITNKE